MTDNSIQQTAEPARATASAPRKAWHKPEVEVLPTVEGVSNSSGGSGNDGLAIHS